MSRLRDGSTGYSRCDAGVIDPSSPRWAAYVAITKALIEDFRAHHGEVTSGPFAGRPALLHLALDPRWTTPDAIPSADEAIEEVETQLGAALDGLAVATEQPAVVKETAEAVDAEADAELAVEDVVEETAEAVDAEADADVSAESQTSSAE